jgi:translation initiation factor 1
MAKKKLYNMDGIVYSTAPDFNFLNENELAVSLPPNEQILTVAIDKKHRGGKTASIIKGFAMNEKEIEVLAKQLKTFCGSGGSAKNNEIIIQGDHKEKILQWLLTKGFKKSRKI